MNAAFSDGFKNYLMQLDFINIQEDEVDDVKHFIEQNLQSTVGYWTEEEVEKKALQWKHDFITVDDVSKFIHRNNTIAIAIES